MFIFFCNLLSNKLNGMMKYDATSQLNAEMFRETLSSSHNFRFGQNTLKRKFEDKTLLSARSCKSKMQYEILIAVQTNFRKTWLEGTESGTLKC